MIGYFTSGKDLPETMDMSSNLGKLCNVIEFTIGSDQEYLSDYIGPVEINELEKGSSILIGAPVGCGKTTALIRAAINYKHEVVYLTNRKSSLLQIKRDVLKEMGITNTAKWDEEIIEHYDTGNIKVLTYQSLAQRENFNKFKNDTLVVLDEIQYLLNDATFSYHPMQIIDILKQNVDNTKRVYISATMEEVLPEIYRIERCDNNELDTAKLYTNFHSRINHIYLMEDNWNHLSFLFYNYSDIDKLTDTINQESENRVKSAIFLRNKERGAKLKEKLTDCQFVYSSEEENEELANIAIKEAFSTKCLLATKVIENGVSINDENIGIIIIEEIDPISFIQFLGRVRVKRRNPRHMTIMIPDYTPSELRQAARQCSERLSIINHIKKSPHDCMMHFEHYIPYIYYSYSGAQANILAYKKFTLLLTHLNKLINDESPHAHIRYILDLLKHSTEIADNQFLNYDDIDKYKQGIALAYKKFKKSPMLKEDRNTLAKELKEIVNCTNYYKKKITGSQLQIETINDILARADINAKISSLGEAFSIEESAI